MREAARTEEPQAGNIHPSSSSSSSKWGHSQRIIIILLFLNLLILMYLVQMSQFTAINSQKSQSIMETKTGLSTVNVTANATTNAWVRPDVIYGLIHVAKTVGTEINTMLSLQYERVCGNKGYSYDAVEANKRFATSGITTENYSYRQPKDSISIHQPDWGRNRVPFAHMMERGFDDCDYIALEEHPDVWNEFYSKWKMELHVPCRDPLNHLMSMCNFRATSMTVSSKRKGKRKGKLKEHDIAINCAATNLAKEVEKCDVFLYRMGREFLNQPNVTLKCFDPLPPESYVNYMGNFLQSKRVRDIKMAHRPSNRPRDKDNECIWKQSKEWQENLIQLLRNKYYYYQYCGECMGSSNQLQTS